ncbi:MAG: hypothetical protein JO039_24595, partial [Solirubrobacterales bacterium]|nr:hypothetical protein [Solirubrobacterales bacterium]
AVAATLAPVAQTLAPITRTLAPVTGAITTTLAPVTRTLAPITTTLAPVTRAITTTLAPVTGTLSRTTASIAQTTVLGQVGSESGGVGHLVTGVSSSGSQPPGPPPPAPATVSPLPRRLTAPSPPAGAPSAMVPSATRTPALTGTNDSGMQLPSISTLGSSLLPSLTNDFFLRRNGLAGFPQTAAPIHGPAAPVAPNGGPSGTGADSAAGGGSGGFFFGVAALLALAALFVPRVLCTLRTFRLSRAPDPYSLLLERPG